MSELGVCGREEGKGGALPLHRLLSGSASVRQTLRDLRVHHEVHLTKPCPPLHNL